LPFCISGRYLEFIIFVNFSYIVYFLWQPATSLQNFIYQRQLAAELLLFVQKFKMAADAILDFILFSILSFMYVGPPT